MEESDFLNHPAPFSPRKQNLTLYVLTSTEKQKKLFEKLGKHSISVSCLYTKRLSDVDAKVLEQVIADAYRYVMKIFRCRAGLTLELAASRG